MYLFNDNVIGELNSFITKSEVSSINLGSYNFDMVLDYVSLQAEKRVDFSIDSIETIWEHGASSTAVWRLMGMRPDHAILLDSRRIQITFESGDSITIYTDESAFECVQFWIGQASNIKHHIF